jgi:hypothetical protein
MTTVSGKGLRRNNTCTRVGLKGAMTPSPGPDLREISDWGLCPEVFHGIEIDLTNLLLYNTKHWFIFLVIMNSKSEIKIIIT